MRDDIRGALEITPASSARERTVDITTIGARSGRPRRIEIWFYRAAGRIYLTTTPARRDWYHSVCRISRRSFLWGLRRCSRWLMAPSQRR